MRDLLPETVLAAVGPADAGALLFLVLAWGAIGWLAEHPFRARPSMTVMMAEVRREWMRQFLRRESRIFDAQIIASLRQGTSFFASTSLLAVGGVLALIGNVTPLTGLAAEIAGEAAPTLLWQIRLFGYCSVMMGAVPVDPDDPRGLPRAMRAAELNIRASCNFNRGLRSLYYALGSLGWLLGPMALVGAVAAVTGLMARREFASVPRDILGGR